MRRAGQLEPKRSCARSRPMWRKWSGCSRRSGSCRQPVRSGSSWSCVCGLAWSRNSRPCVHSRDRQVPQVVAVAVVGLQSSAPCDCQNNCERRRSRSWRWRPT
uniref:AMOTL2 protein n=1 Tax=Homo sapiens TaxID=9606 RepID=Q8TBR8_HUMAN|nr:AMOTL2 protein [Homo sapiens]